MEKIQESEYAFPYHQTVNLVNGQLFYKWDGALSYYCRFKLIEEVLKSIQAERVIEIGCGDGVIITNLARIFVNRTFVGIDYSSRAIEHANLYANDIGNIQFVTSNILEDGIQSSNSDMLILTEVLEHIPIDQVEEFTSKCIDHLRIGGKIVVTVPSANKEIEEKHFQHFTRDGLIRLFISRCSVEAIKEIAPKKDIFSKVYRILIDNKIYVLKPHSFLYRYLSSAYFRKFRSTKVGNGYFAVFEKRF